MGARRLFGARRTRALAEPPAANRQPGQVSADGSAGRGIDELMADVQSLRLTLATDLTLAAEAVDSGASDFAADVLDGDRAEVARFLGRSFERLRAMSPVVAAAPPTPRPAARRRAPAARWLPLAPLVAAAGLVVAILLGDVRVPGDQAQTEAVAQSWIAFTRATTGDEPAGQVIAAADQLHRSLALLIDDGRHDPAAARQALQLLELEQLILLRDHPAGMAAVLRESRALAAQLLALPGIQVPPVVATSAASVAPTSVERQLQRVLSVAPSPKPTTSPSATPEATTTPAPAPSPDPSASQTSPSPSRSSTSSPQPSTGVTHLPGGFEL